MAPLGGSAASQRGSFLRLAFLQRKPPRSQNTDGSGEQGDLGGRPALPAPVGAAVLLRIPASPTTLSFPLQ